MGYREVSFLVCIFFWCAYALLGGAKIHWDVPVEHLLNDENPLKKQRKNNVTMITSVSSLPSYPLNSKAERSLFFVGWRRFPAFSVAASEDSDFGAEIASKMRGFYWMFTVRSGDSIGISWDFIVIKWIFMEIWYDLMTFILLVI